MKLLEVQEINTYYGMSHILFGLSLAVDAGEIVSLLGRNGAGKSTTFRSIIGLSKPRSGRILFRGEDLSGKPPYFNACKGIGYVPEEKRIFKQMTVLENLEVGAKKGNRNRSEWSVEKIFGMFSVLEKYSDQVAGRLSGGEQQMLAIGRTLMGNPDLVLLDEPTTGLSPLIVRALKHNIFSLPKSGPSVFLAEQNTKFALDISSRAYILDKGEIQYEAPVENLLRDEDTIKKYLAI